MSQSRDAVAREAIAVFANTFVGKPGNIGVRTAKVLTELSAVDQSAFCVCRGASERASMTSYVTMGLLGQVPRVLNAVRIYLWWAFQHRRYDIQIFEKFSEWHLDRTLPSDIRVAHVWDMCPRLIRRLKSDGVKVLLDVPIAPATYTQRLVETGEAPFFLVDQYQLKTELEAFQLADLLIAPSMFVADELVSAGVDRKRVRVVEFGVDLVAVDRRSVDADSNSNSKSGLDFCFVGSINRRKGVRELLKAWQSPAFKDDRLHLCGRVFPDAKPFIARNSSGAVILPGFVNPFEYLMSCDVFILPSWLEGSAKAVYEAMACGLPAIVSSSTGSIVRDGIDGFVLEPGNVDSLRERMIWFKRNRDEIGRMGSNAREYVANYDWGRYAARIVSLYMGQIR